MVSRIDALKIQYEHNKDVAFLYIGISIALFIVYFTTLTPIYGQIDIINDTIHWTTGILAAIVLLTAMIAMIRAYNYYMELLYIYDAEGVTLDHIEKMNRRFWLSREKNSKR